MRQRILIWLVIALCVVTAVIMSPASKKGFPRPLLSVSFQNHSNSPTGKCFAILGVTNRDSCSLRFEGSGWLQFPGTNTEVDAASAIDYSVLKRGASCVLVIEIPPHQSKWRVVWAITRLTPRELIRSTLPNWSILRSFHEYVGTVGFASEWMPN